jgi:probable blue pigment (indigoidine) exporter
VRSALAAADPNVLAIVAMVCWGTAYVPSSLLIDSWPPLIAAGARLGLAGVLLLVVAWITRGNVRTGARPLTVAWLGLTQTTLFYGATFIGIAHAGAGLAAVLSNTDPLFVAALGAVFLGERLRRRQWVGLLIGLVGAAVVVAAGSLWPPEVSWTAMVVVFGAFAWSVGTITAARSVRDTGSPLALAGWQMAFGGLLLLVAGAVVDPGLDGVGARELALVVVLAVFGSATPLFVFYLALRRAPAGEVSAWFFLVPVIGVLMAWPLLGETPTTSLVVGMVAVALGLWLVLGAERRWLGGTPGA